MENQRLISIITIVFNEAKCIEATIKSIANQTYQDFEYIIVDGGSTDGTIDIIKKYSNYVTKWISEPDNGLYDAMNKGLNMAEGRFVWFINAGDWPYRDNTFQIVADFAYDNPDVIYGDTMIIDDNGNEIGLRRLKPGPDLSWKSLINGLIVCHQAIIIKKEIAGLYNLKYRIAADYDWIINALKRANIIVYSNNILINFLDGGINKKNIKRALKERFSIMVKNFGLLMVLWNHIKIAARIVLFFIKNKRI